MRGKLSSRAGTQQNSFELERSRVWLASLVHLIPVAVRLADLMSFRNALVLTVDIPSVNSFLIEKEPQKSLAFDTGKGVG